MHAYIIADESRRERRVDAHQKAIKSIYREASFHLCKFCMFVSYRSHRSLIQYKNNLLHYTQIVYCNSIHFKIIFSIQKKIKIKLHIYWNAHKSKVATWIGCLCCRVAVEKIQLKRRRKFWLFKQKYSNV